MFHDILTIVNPSSRNRARYKFQTSYRLISAKNYFTGATYEKLKSSFLFELFINFFGFG
jgi:hypothetical protein